MYRPTRYNVTGGFRGTATRRNALVGEGSGGSMTTGTDNMLIGKGAGRLISTGSENVILGGYPGTPDLRGDFVISHTNGDVMARWDAAGAHTVRVADVGVTPSPVLAGEVTTAYDSAAGCLVHRFADGEGIVRTVSIGAAPPPLSVWTQPTHVTEADGALRVDRSIATIDRPVPMTVLEFDPTESVRGGKASFVLAGLPPWADGAVFDLFFALGPVSQEITGLPVELWFSATERLTATMDVPVLPVGGPVGARFEITEQSSLGADGAYRPRIPPGNGASFRPLQITLQSPSGAPLVNLTILGWEFALRPDTSSVASQEPRLPSALTVRSAGAGASVSIARYQTNPVSGPLLWSIRCGEDHQVLTIEPRTGTVFVDKTAVLPVTATVTVTDVFGSAASSELTVVQEV